MADDTEGLSAFSVLSVSVVLRQQKCEHHEQGVEGDTAVVGGVGVRGVAFGSRTTRRSAKSAKGFRELRGLSRIS